MSHSWHLSNLIFPTGHPASGEWVRYLEGKWSIGSLSSEGGSSAVTSRLLCSCLQKSCRKRPKVKYQSPAHLGERQSWIVEGETSLRPRTKEREKVGCQGEDKRAPSQGFGCSGLSSTEALARFYNPRSKNSCCVRRAEKKNKERERKWSYHVRRLLSSLCLCTLQLRGCGGTHGANWELWTGRWKGSAAVPPFLELCLLDVFPSVIILKDYSEKKIFEERLIESSRRECFKVVTTQWLANTATRPPVLCQSWLTKRLLPPRAVRPNLSYSTRANQWTD